MKLEHVSGCVCDSLTIDDVETADMGLDELKSKTLKFVESISDLSVLQSILISISELTGEYEDLGHCEQCGDFISKYTVEINE